MNKYLFLSAVLVSFLFACQKNAEDIRLLPPTLMSTRTADSVHLRINAVYGFLPVLPYSYDVPDKFEIYESEGDMNSFEKIATINNDASYRYSIGGLQPGVSYFYYVKSKKSGLETVYSDTIMVIPNTPETLIRAVSPTDFPVQSAALSPNGATIAYSNPAYTWDNGMYGATTLFLYDLATAQNTLIQRSAVYPDWSPAGDKIAFCTDKDEVGVPGYRPQQLAVYNLATDSITRLTTGSIFTLHPEFSADGQWIVYSSDEGHPNEFDIWKIAADGTQKTKLTNGLGHGSFTPSTGLGMPSWAPDGSAILMGVQSSNPDQKGIFKINLQNNTVVPVIQSQWEDSSPSISPDGQKMAFFSNRSGLAEVWIYSLNTGDYQQVTGFNEGFINNNWSKIEWVGPAELLFGGYDGTQFETVYRVKM
jgi:Tol biopolymer transport system component